MIISIGVDCYVADFIKKYKLRSWSFPFDWIVSYNGVSKCIEDDFNSFMPNLENRINKYDMFFYHDFKHSVQDDTTKYCRRVERFKNILNTSTEQITFCRKGHCPHHHAEQNGNYNTITNDIEDAIKLDLVLKRKYPKLQYKIIVILVCNRCFNPTTIYESINENIKIHNIAMDKIDNIKFENCLKKLFLN